MRHPRQAQSEEEPRGGEDGPSPDCGAGGSGRERPSNLAELRLEARSSGTVFGTKN